MMVLLSALVGLGVGSLINWGSDRLPRSAHGCPTSQPGSAALPAWLQLLTSLWPSRGRLHSYKPAPLAVGVEIAAALCFACLWMRCGLTWKLALAWVYSFLLLIATIDLKHRLVPNVLVYPAAAAVMLFHAFYPGQRPLEAFLGCVVGLSPFLLVALLKPGSMGGGDIKLAALIGLTVGFPRVLWPISLSIVAGGMVSIVLLLTRRWGPESEIPYAPFLCLGAMVSLLYNPLSVPVSM